MMALEIVFFIINFNMINLDLIPKEIFVIMPFFYYLETQISNGTILAKYIYIEERTLF
jgi:hypothetical protein